MRTLASTTLLAIGLFNCCLAYTSQSLADQMAHSYQVLGLKLPPLTAIALKLPPGFYVVALVAATAAALGFARKLRDITLLFSAVAILFADAMGLMGLMWGYCIPYMLIGNPI